MTLFALSFSPVVVVLMEERFESKLATFLVFVESLMAEEAEKAAVKVGTPTFLGNSLMTPCVISRVIAKETTNQLP